MDELLSKYFLGELSNAEKETLFQHIASNEADKAEFIRMQNTVTLSSLVPQKGDEAWSARKMNELGMKINRKYTRTIFLKTVKYAAVAIILLVNAWLLSDKFFPKEKTSLFTKIEVPKGQRIYMTLPDGTEAWLSPRSVIKIPNEFRAGERVVELDGEGFFSVTKDAQRPFIVKTQHYDIKVLGTKFNVFAYSKGPWFETDLVEGRVDLLNNENPEKAMTLIPNEKVRLVNNELIKSVSVFNNEEYLKSGIFNFSNKQFSDILEYLSLWYNVKFEIKNKTQLNHYISGKFRQSDEVINILKALQDVHRFKYKMITNELIEIY